MKHLLLLTVLTVSIRVSAQQAISFSLQDVTNGATVSLDQFKNSAAVVVVFTSNDCPFDNSYTDRIGTLVNSYASRIPVLLINAHLDPPESEENMKKESSGWNFRAPYLSDKNQVAMDALGARRSPEAFVLKPGATGFTVVYSGALDDNPQTPGAVSVQYLRDAIEAVLGGKPVPASVRAAGCSIRKR